MLRSLPLVLTALLTLGACGDATPSVQTDAATVEASPSLVAEAAGDVDAESAEASAPVSTPDSAPANAPSEAAARPAAPAGGSTPMVEVNVDASVEHATSGAKTLTLRSGPSTSTANMGTFSYGQVLECQDLKRDDAWCRIRAEMPNGPTFGWAKRRHLSYVGNIMEDEAGVRMFGDPSVWGGADGFPVDSRWDILADDGYANVRSTPGADGALVQRLDNRVMTDVVRCDSGAPGRRWCEISSPVSGWVHQSGFHRQLRSL